MIHVNRLYVSINCDLLPKDLTYDKFDNFCKNNNINFKIGKHELISKEEKDGPHDISQRMRALSQSGTFNIEVWTCHSNNIKLISNIEKELLNKFKNTSLFKHKKFHSVTSGHSEWFYGNLHKAINIVENYIKNENSINNCFENLQSVEKGITIVDQKIIQNKLKQTFENRLEWIRIELLHN